MDFQVVDPVSRTLALDPALQNHLALLGDLQKRVREITVLQLAGRVLQDTRQPVAEWLRQIVAVLPNAAQAPHLTAARISYNGQAFETPGFHATANRQQAEFSAATGERGVIELVQLEVSPGQPARRIEQPGFLESLADMLRGAIDGKRSWEMLEQKQRDLEWLINSVDGIVWESRPNTFEFHFVSRQAERLLGYPIDQWYTPNFWIEHMHPEDRLWAPDYCAREARAGRLHEFEYRMIASDGRVVWLHDLVSPAHDVPGKLHGLMIDVTARRESEVALRTSYHQVQELAGSLIAAKESERTSIARELHDGITQQLAAAAVGMSVLQNKIAPEHQEEMRRLNSLVQQAMDSVRNLSHELHPAVLQHSGLIAALTSHINEFSRQHEMRVSLHVEGVDEVRGTAAVGLFRVAQEALHNVVKHAYARVVRVGVRRIDNQLELIVHDDGRGFDVMAARQSSGLGLISIEERVRMMRGTTDFESGQGNGTRLRVRVPAELVAVTA